MRSAWGWVAGCAGLVTAAAATLTATGRGDTVIAVAGVATAVMVLGRIQTAGDRWIWGLAALAWAVAGGAAFESARYPVGAGAVTVAVAMTGHRLGSVKSQLGSSGDARSETLPASGETPGAIASTEEEW